MEVVPLSPLIAAEVRGLDVSAELDATTLRELHEAWFAHLVLVFRGQRLSDEALVRFSRHFGELELAPIGDAANPKSDGTVPNMPEVIVVSNVVEDGVAIGVLGAGEAIWHTDMSYIPEPPSASLLYALEVPPSGGDTSILNMYEAYAALPPDSRTKVERLEAKHDASHNSAGKRRKGFQTVTDVSQAPGAKHPMLRTHPVTGRKALYLGRRRNAYGAATPMSSVSRSRRANGRSMNCGRPCRRPNTSIRTNGRPATSCSGTTAAPCTDGTPSTRPRVASCTAPRSKATSRSEPGCLA